MKKAIAWSVEANGAPEELNPGTIDYEKNLENWIDKDIRIVADDVLLIGRQVETHFKTTLDLLGIDASGQLVVLELKKDKTLRETIAQALEYAACVCKFEPKQILSLASARFGSEDAFGTAFATKFGTEFPSELNKGQRVLVVAPSIDDNTAEVIAYLASKHQVPINAVSFDVFDDHGRQLLVRHLVLEQAFELPPPATKAKTRTIEQFMDEAAKNGVGELFQQLLGLQDLLPIQERFWQSFALKTKTGDKHTLAGFSLYATAETSPGRLDVVISPVNLSSLYGLSMNDAQEFIQSLAEIGSVKKAWGTWQRLSLTVPDGAVEFERRYRAMVASAGNQETSIGGAL